MADINIAQFEHLFQDLGLQISEANKLADKISVELLNSFKDIHATWEEAVRQIYQIQQADQ